MPKVIGAKQVRKAITSKKAKKVYIAQDAEPHIIEPIKLACEEHEVEYEIVLSKELLGKNCGIDVGSATVAILNE
ncbi:MAG: 50S ribosomal protein L7ae-like protein [Syntrophomonadaceae bacterium]|nr:50S ribosomal protein L7ae-like protein [Syntrophomonadaceae bacterium]